MKDTQKFFRALSLLCVFDFLKLLQDCVSLCELTRQYARRANSKSQYKKSVEESMSFFMLLLA